MKQKKGPPDIDERGEQFKDFFSVSGKKSTTRSNHILFFRLFRASLVKDQE